MCRLRAGRKPSRGNEAMNTSLAIEFFQRKLKIAMLTFAIYAALC